MKKNLLYVLMIGLTFMFTACPEEETIEPYAYFEVSSTIVSVDELISFNNLSEDAETYGWNFGDGNISTEYSPIHSYDEAGSYSVVLIAYNKSKKSQYDLTISVEGETVNLEACFNASPSNVQPGQEVSFTNCSEGADSYNWDFGDGGSSTSTNPSYVYNQTGTYTVTLTAYSGSNSDETTRSITVSNEPISFDPYDYNSMPSNGWSSHYYTDYSDPNSSDWTQDGEGDLRREIVDDKYIVENMSYESGYLFWTEAALMPSESANFDIDVYLQIVNDDSTYGAGALWGINESTYDYFYYKYTPYQSEIWYLYGNAYGSWSPDGWGQGGNYGGYNLLSIRKYQSKYYFFMNEVFIGENDFESYYGNFFGFFVGVRAKMEVEEYGIFLMDFNSKKSAKQKSKVPTPSNGKGSVTAKAKSQVKLK